MNPIEFLQLDFRAIISTLVLMVLLLSLFLTFVALAAGVQNIALNKVLLASILITFAQWSIAAVFYFVPVVGGILGFMLNILA